MSGEVVVAEGVWGEAFDSLARSYDVVRCPASGELETLLPAARALVVRNGTQVDAHVFEVAKNLKVVARAGVGLDNIDLDAANSRGVVVVSPVGANASAVAEHTIALALALLRNVTGHDRAVRAGQWVRTAGREIAGSTWGMLGLGATGRAVARLAAGFDTRVLAYDPYVEVAANGVEITDLDTVLASSDVLSVHLPATPETREFIDATVLSRLRPSAILVNVGRGEVVDESALADALRDGRLAGAALDVRAAEPPGPGPLDDLPNVIYTPHVAGITEGSQQRIAAILAEDIAAVLAGNSATHAVGEHDRPRPPAPLPVGVQHRKPAQTSESS